MNTLRHLSILALMAVSLIGYAAKPELSIEPKKYNFGNIKENAGPVSTEFIITNTGDAPLVIKDARASCGCTKPTYPKEPIRPGESAKLRVTYTPAGRPGEFDKTVTVRSNAKNSKTTARITGIVIPD